MLTLKQIRELSNGDYVIAWYGHGAPSLVRVTGEAKSEPDAENGLPTIMVRTASGFLSQDVLYTLSEAKAVIENARKRNERDAVAISETSARVNEALREQKRQRAAERRAAKQERRKCGKCGVMGARGLICLQCGAPAVGETQEAQ